MTLTLSRPWTNIRTEHRLIILKMCAELFEKPARGFQITLFNLFNLEI